VSHTPDHNSGHHASVPSSKGSAPGGKGGKGKK
jgi:hypothetical protein